MGLETIALYAIIAGAGVTAYGQIQQGKAAEAQAKAEQEILNQNAVLKEREAAAELERSRAAAERFEREGEAPVEQRGGRSHPLDGPACGHFTSRGEVHFPQPETARDP